MEDHRRPVHAFDLYKGRVGLIRQGAASGWGLPAWRPSGCATATQPYEGLPPMDGVLCDVPCSGYGVIRRKPEIRYKPLSSARDLPALQLSHPGERRRPGAVPAGCSSTPPAP